jgi:hypothetical protein
MKVAVTIPEDLERDLEVYLEAHDEPLEETLQRALRVYLEHQQMLVLDGKAYPKPKHPLRFTPAENGSGKGDISINHDAYLVEDTYRRKLPTERRESALQTDSADDEK